MKFLRRHGGESTTLKMTAMIDVVFLLLIFFIVGTKFRVPEGELDAYLPGDGAPPDTQVQIIVADEIRVSLRIAKGGVGKPTVAPVVFLDGKRLGAGIARGSMTWLSEELEKLARDVSVREEVPVIIDPEPRLAYRWVIQTLNICRKARFKTVKFAAAKPATPPADAAKTPG